MSAYLDNAATSWPKPETVYQVVDRFMREVGARPGRGGHRQEEEAAHIADETRAALAELLHAPDPNGVAFTMNATQAINMALKSLGIPFLVDAAQTAGAYPIDMQAMNIDLLAFPGHKGLFAPHGTGGLVVRPGLTLET